MVCCLDLMIFYKTVFSGVLLLTLKVITFVFSDLFPFQVHQSMGLVFSFVILSHPQIQLSIRDHQHIIRRRFLCPIK